MSTTNPMRRRLIAALGAAPLATGLPGWARARNATHDSGGRNPVLPPEVHIPDPEAHVMPDGRLYIYGSWDRHDDTYCSRQYRVFSTPDLRTWRDDGVSFDSATIPWLATPVKYPGGVDWSNPTPFLRKMMDEAKKDPDFKIPKFPRGQLFAPDAIQYKGRYYLFFCLEDGSEGVAVADHPQGPFRQPVQLPCTGIDPAIFVDRDGAAYYYWGQFAAHGARLAPSLTGFVDGSEVRELATEGAHFFHEGSSMRRRGDMYYFVYASVERGKPTTLSYATSDSPLGPFRHRGVIIDNALCDPKAWNNHGSIEEIGGQWYVFYHRSSRNSQYRRRLCVEPIEFRADGTIAEVLMTSQGAGKPFHVGETIPAWRACEVHGHCWIGPGSAGQEALHAASDQDSAVFRYVTVDGQPGDIRLAGSGSGVVDIYVDGDEAAVARCIVKDGRGVARLGPISPGKRTVRLRFVQSTGLELQSLQLV